VRVDEAIASSISQLVDFPKLGRVGRVDATRELAISHTPYVAPYLIDGDNIRVLRILHGAQLWPEGFELE
jgi:toxin ParE1/3/4